MKRFIIVLALSTIALGCDKPTDTPSTAASSKADDNKPVVLTDEDVPVRGDFAEEAEGAINKDNYKGELDKLATEIGTE